MHATRGRLVLPRPSTAGGLRQPTVAAAGGVACCKRDQTNILATERETVPRDPQRGSEEQPDDDKDEIRVDGCTKGRREGGTDEQTDDPTNPPGRGGPKQSFNLMMTTSTSNRETDRWREQHDDTNDNHDVSIHRPSDGQVLTDKWTDGCP